jgi:hypothetical protein
MVVETTRSHKKAHALSHHILPPRGGGVRACLLDSLLAAARARSRLGRAIWGVNVKIAWASHGLLLLLLRVVVVGPPPSSSSLSSSRGGRKADDVVWTDGIDTLAGRRRRGRGRRGGRSSRAGATTAATTVDEDGPPNDPADDERMMIETIHSILDGGGGSRGRDWRHRPLLGSGPAERRSRVQADPIVVTAATRSETLRGRTRDRAAIPPSFHRLF